VLARAVLEGAAFAIRDQLDLLRTGGATVTELRVSGGDARLDAWNRIKADVIGLPVVTIPGDAAVGGVAMLAGLGSGRYGDVDDAIRRCVRSSNAIEPNPSAHTHYTERFARGASSPPRTSPAEGARPMRLELGINTCFAVKRWPTPADWAPIVRDRLGLRLVQHSLDLVDFTADRLAEQADEVRDAIAANGLALHSTFTGLAAYSANLLLAPQAAERESALAWYRSAIGFTALVGGRATGGHVGAFSVPDWRDPDRRRARWQDLQRDLENWRRTRARPAWSTSSSRTSRRPANRRRWP
jgi:hypothetical protein